MWEGQQFYGAVVLEAARPVGAGRGDVDSVQDSALLAAKAGARATGGEERLIVPGCPEAYLRGPRGRVAGRRFVPRDETVRNVHRHLAVGTWKVKFGNENMKV